MENEDEVGAAPLIAAAAAEAEDKDKDAAAATAARARLVLLSAFSALRRRLRMLVSGDRDALTSADDAEEADEDADLGATAEPVLWTGDTTAASANAAAPLGDDALARAAEGDGGNSIGYDGSSSGDDDDSSMEL